MSHRRKPQPRPYVRSREELEAALRRQYGFLVKSAALFDAGDADEARRLALTLRVLLRGDKSLLHLLGLRKQLRFLDSALRHTRVPGAIVVGCELATMRTDFDANRTSWAAPLDGRQGEQPPGRFASWWGAPVVTTSKGMLSREQIVLPMANQDGGAHEDRHLTEDYADFLAETRGVTFFADGQPQASLPGDLACVVVRQIAHEVQRTLQRDWRSEPLIA
jgi:hypothetical protein